MVSQDSLQDVAEAENDESANREGPLLRGGNRRALPVEHAISLISSRHRRSALLFLRTRPNQPIPLETVVDEIARRNGPHETGSDARRAIRIEMRHQHLPKLEDADVVSFDEETSKLRYSSDPVLEQFLNVVDELEA